MMISMMNEAYVLNYILLILILEIHFVTILRLEIDLSVSLYSILNKYLIVLFRQEKNRLISINSASRHSEK